MDKNKGIQEQYAQVLDAVLELGVTHRVVELDRDKWKEKAESSANDFELRDKEVFDTTARAVEAEEDRNFWKKRALEAQNDRDFWRECADRAKSECDEARKQAAKAEEDRDFWRGSAVEETEG